jgi:hypothetical protein
LRIINQIYNHAIINNINCISEVLHTMIPINYHYITTRTLTLH